MYTCLVWYSLLKEDAVRTRIENLTLCHSDYAAILRQLRTEAGQSSTADDLDLPAHFMQ